MPGKGGARGSAKTKKVSRQGTIALCLEKESESKKNLPGDRVILRCAGILRGVSAKNAAMSFRGKGLVAAPNSAFTELHLCKGRGDRVPKVSSREDMPKGRALFRCYKRGDSVPDLEEYAGVLEEEEGSPASAYSEASAAAASPPRAPVRSPINMSLVKLSRAKTRKSYPREANLAPLPHLTPLKKPVDLTALLKSASASRKPERSPVSAGLVKLRRTKTRKSYPREANLARSGRP